MICQGMSGNGVQTGIMMITFRSLIQKILRVQTMVLKKLCAEDHGSAMMLSVMCLGVTNLSQTIEIPISVFVVLKIYNIEKNNDK